MDHFSVLPDSPIVSGKTVADRFRQLGIATFHEACRYVHGLPYGYNADRDDQMTLFSEQMGSCTTKHAVIASLAAELRLPINKHIGIYAMTEAIVSGTDRILERYGLPYLPMIHCFLVHGPHRVDLTEGNRNGKNRPIDDFLYTEPVAPTIPAKEEYLKYRTALRDLLEQREELRGTAMKTILHAREAGIALLKANLNTG